MREVVQRNDECRGVAGDAQKAGDTAGRLGRQDAFQDSGKRVDYEGREYKILFAERSLIVLPTQELNVADETGKFLSGGSTHHDLRRQRCPSKICQHGRGQVN